MYWLLAHQGGWDEALMFIVPIAIALGAVKWAEHRGRRKPAESDDARSHETPNRAPDTEYSIPATRPAKPD